MLDKSEKQRSQDKAPRNANKTFNWSGEVVAKLHLWGWKGKIVAKEDWKEEKFEDALIWGRILDRMSLSSSFGIVERLEHQDKRIIGVLFSLIIKKKFR